MVRKKTREAEDRRFKKALEAGTDIILAASMDRDYKDRKTTRAANSKPTQVRQIEISVRGLKRKAFRQVQKEDKGDTSDRGKMIYNYIAKAISKTVELKENRGKQPSIL